MKIKLFTFYYPFGNEEQFLHEEIIYLVNQGVQITVIPFEVKGEMRKLPSSVTVDKSMAKELKRNSELKVYPLFKSFGAILKALFQHKVRNASGLRDVVGFAHHGRIIREWASNNIQSDDVLYTYWFERITYGLADYLKKCKLNNILVSRAHGYDLYTERRKHNFIPFREKTLQRLDQIFTISEDGKDYLVEKYGFQSKIQKAYLGIKDHGISEVSKQDDLIRLASCSSIIPLKRVDLIARVIKLVCEENPSMNVEWNHFGEGNASEVEKELLTLPSNLKVKLHGNIPNEKLISFYKNTYVDLFINLSTTEGLPVSIMEAISFGIPVLAADVGGVSEIVNDSTGILLKSTFDLEEANKGITTILKGKDLRISTRKFFEENFVGERNYHSFYTQLKQLKS